MQQGITEWGQDEYDNEGYHFPAITAETSTVKTTEYTISKGNQYDPEGTSIKFGILHAAVKVVDGNIYISAGDMPRHWDALAEAICRVIETGITETVIL